MIRYLFVLALFFMQIVVAEAQVARVSSGGTTLYSEEKEIYIPNNPQVSAPKPAVLKEPKKITVADYPESINKGQEENSQEMKDNPVMKILRSPLKNFGDQRTARNILIVKEVVDFKLGDERLREDMEDVENNREYLKKIQSIMTKLSNKKLRNLKNKEVIRILDDAGNKIYNLLAD